VTRGPKRSAEGAFPANQAPVNVQDIQDHNNNWREESIGQKKAKGGGLKGPFFRILGEGSSAICKKGRGVSHGAERENGRNQSLVQAEALNGASIAPKSWKKN